MGNPEEQDQEEQDPNLKLLKKLPVRAIIDTPGISRQEAQVLLMRKGKEAPGDTPLDFEDDPDLAEIEEAILGQLEKTGAIRPRMVN